MEKSEILPPFPQQSDDGDDEKERVPSINILVEKAAIDVKTPGKGIDRLVLSSDHLHRKERYRK